MKVVNLDANFTPFGDGESYEESTFSGGEPHFSCVIDTSEDYLITTRLSDSDRLTKFLVAADAIKRQNPKSLKAFIPYFPGARQDRVCNPGEALTAKVYCDLINQIGLDQVFIFDVHSDVVPALLDNCNALNNHQLVSSITRDLKEFVLISPDGGALKRVFKLAQYLGGVRVIEASKRRDTKTGKLTSFHVYEEDLSGLNCLVVDDICDGGGTFLGLAEALQKKNANELYLFASHGIFAKGFDHLTPHYNKMYTTNSFRDFKDDRIIQIPLTPKVLDI